MWTPTLLIAGWPGPGELLIIFAIVLLLFGGSKLPQVARSMGQAMRAFKEEAHKLKSEIELEAESEPQKTQTSKEKPQDQAAAQGHSSADPKPTETVESKSSP